eukprot:scaffold152192_cov18-Tisochrysis_lutea.AAC.1
MGYLRHCARGNARPGILDAAAGVSGCSKKKADCSAGTTGAGGTAGAAAAAACKLEASASNCCCVRGCADWADGGVEEEEVKVWDERESREREGIVG